MVKNNLKKTVLAIFLTLALGIFTYFNFLAENIIQLRNLGIPENILYLFLIIPVITCLISFVRHFIGINISSFYLPLLLIISVSTLGFINTIILLFTAWLLVVILKLILKNYHLHASSKNGLILSFTSIIFLLFLPFLLKFDIFTSITPNFFILILLILILLIDKFINVQIKFSFKKDLIYIFKNLIFSIFCVILLGETVNLGIVQIYNPFLKNLILSYPDLTLFLSFIFSILIGRYTGLRLDELIRFRALINKK